MSIVLRKRQYIRPHESVISDFDSKRFRLSTSPSDPEIIFFPVSSFEETLSRLSLLFPTMESKQLSECLEQADNNLEEAIKLLDDLSISKQDLARHYAKALVSQFENVSKEQAIEIAADAFKQYYQEKRLEEANKEPLSSRLPQDTERLKQGIHKLVYDNATLKKAVVKLKERVDAAQALETENLMLKNELQNLSIANYTLKMHLENALDTSSGIEKSKDIF